MGSQLSKGGVALDGQAAAAADGNSAKTNGQENGHVKTNGNAKSSADATVTNGSTEAGKEAESAAGDAIEPAPATEGVAAKPDGEATKETGKKKKKKFSLKNSFKFKGISLKKSKKGSGQPKEEAAVSPAAEENPTPSEDKVEVVLAEETAQVEESSKVEEELVLPEEGTTETTKPAEEASLTQVPSEQREE